MINRFISILIETAMKNSFVVVLLGLAVIWLGWSVSPYGPNLQGVISQVPVDAIPDIGENQQIVFTPWPGRSPQDVEDQLTYPLTSSLLGIPSVKTIRSTSMFGFSTISVIFDEKVEFYFSRSRILEKLNSLPPGTLPAGATPTLGPDATALGQIYWYTLEGRDENGEPAGGWDLNELRSIQDWTVRFALQAAEGVAEVASVGGFVQEYQIDVDPDAMTNYSVTIRDVYKAVRRGNIDVGGGTIEVNGPEYFIRGLGFAKSVEDLESIVVKVKDNIPIYVRQVANVHLGPAARRGMLDKEGSEAVGGVVVARFGANPLRTIEAVEQRIQELALSLPVRTLADGSSSRVTVVPFYNRAKLIGETLGTLSEALKLEMIITIIVILFLVMHFRSAILITGLLPLTVMATFIAMWYFKVDANIVALSGIAIAIGTIVDMGIVMCENILRYLQDRDERESIFNVILAASKNVGGAVFTAVATTVVSFLPVFFMEGSEGKLFKPLAYTKTFALVTSVLITLVFIPSFAYQLLRKRDYRSMIHYGRWLAPSGWIVLLFIKWQLALALSLFALIGYALTKVPHKGLLHLSHYLLAILVAFLLAKVWLPLGVGRGLGPNLLFVGLLVFGLLGGVLLFIRGYAQMLGWCLRNKLVFLCVPAFLVVLWPTIWLGFERTFSFLPKIMETSRLWQAADHHFPGLGKEFMPALDEGSFLFMPSTMPHASLNEGADMIAAMDMAIRSIPEVSEVVGKLGRVESSLDPAPVSMVETVVNYTSEFRVDEHGHRLRFRYDERTESYARDEANALIPDPKGRPYRQWRDQIQSPKDIWDEIATVAAVPGATSAPMLQPIATRLIMLQSGMRAPMGVKVKGPDLQTIETAGLLVEKLLKQVPSVAQAAVLAERIVGKPYLEFEIHREVIARFGLNVQDVTDIIELAISGKAVSYTLEGRERYLIRLRYPRELRDNLERIQNVLVPIRGDLQIPLKELATLRYTRGPQSIKSENAQLVSYVLFDKRAGYTEVEVVEEARAYITSKQAQGYFPKGISLEYAGTYESQVRSEQRLKFIMPLALGLIFLILYLQFGEKTTTLFIFSGVFVAWSGGFLMLWLYGQDWFLNIEMFGTNLREIFQIHPYNLSVAVWVGFLALFGIATDDGVIMGTYLKQTFEESKPQSIEAIRAATLKAGLKRIRPCLMTSATTILALIPILTSSGRGSDIMIPMAIPSFGGMLVVLITTFVVPTLFCWREELLLPIQP